jgi:AAA15 family ATPase/GTPase
MNSYNYINSDEPSDISDILGIYGQNGSGKTTLIDSLNLLKYVIKGEPLPDNTTNLISFGDDFATLSTKFLIQDADKEFLVDYSLELKKKVPTKTSEKTGKVIVSKERLDFIDLSSLDKTRKVKVKMIDYDIDNELTCFVPKKRYNDIIRENAENIYKINIARAFSLKDSTSYIFSELMTAIFRNSESMDERYPQIINALQNFANKNLFVIKTDQLGQINSDHLMPFNFKINSKASSGGNRDNYDVGDSSSITNEYIENTVVSDGFTIHFFDNFSIPEEMYDIMTKIIEQINIVLSALIPELKIELCNLGAHLSTSTQKLVNIELISRRGDLGIPLKYESEGIKKIISILSVMIAVYNNEGVCLAIDELDSGVFEYLLGEILEVFEKNSNGQFIFTSHNLRPLERLSKESVVFTTTNPENRYLRLVNVKKTDNLRDFYLRLVILGGQKEEIYRETNSFEIRHAFRKAGDLR